MFKRRTHLEFTRYADKKAANFLKGAGAIHDGYIPPAKVEVDVVRFEGEELVFVDPSIPERLHRAMLDGAELDRRRYISDSVTLVAMMKGVDLAEAARQYLALPPTFSFDYDEGERVDMYSQLPPNVSVGLFSRYHDNNDVFRTVAYPAAIRQQKGVLPEHTYLSKLGDEGPIVIAGLTETMIAWGANIKAPLNGISLK